MLKRTSLFAIGPSIGAVLGAVIIPRTVFPYRYNETYPPLLLQAGLSLLVAYTVSFLVVLLMERIKRKMINSTGDG